MRIGYCTNVHPGRTIEEVKQNLTKFSVSIKQKVSLDRPLGIGLWLSATAVSELQGASRKAEFTNWIADKKLFPFTINGFPFGDFHQAVVKHQVYQPDWSDASRLNYTLELAEILDELLGPSDVCGSISTLPLGWPNSSQLQNDDFLAACSEHLIRCAIELNRRRENSGRRITLCIEPEPGCILDSSEDVVTFFEHWLFRRRPELERIIREHITVCHDVCHSSVMFEEQSLAIENYRKAGIQIGKVQVSSAVQIDFDKLSRSEKSAAFEQLRSFSEPRYLHQTVWKQKPESTPILYEDLPLFLQTVDPATIEGCCRVHFHVPIFADRLGLIETTQGAILDCLGALSPESSEPKAGNSRSESMPEHFEIETYAWNVLPKEWQPESLVDGISREWLWFEEQLKQKHPIASSQAAL